MTNDFNALDWAIVLIAGASTVFGFRAGFARVVIGFAAGVLGIVLGFWFYQVPAAWFTRVVSSPTAADALGFLTVFGAVLLAGGVLARLLVSIFRWAGLGWLDRLMGAAAGFLRGMIVIIGIVTPLIAFSVEPAASFFEQSRLAPYTLAFGRLAIAAAPKAAREQFEAKADYLVQIWKREFPSLPGTGKPDSGRQPGKVQPLKKESY